MMLTSIDDAEVLPSQAIQTGQQGHYADVVKCHGSVEIRPVAPGRVNGGEEVIQMGIQSGNRAMTDGPLMLYPGAEAMIWNSLPPASGSQP